MVLDEGDGRFKACLQQVEAHVDQFTGPLAEPFLVCSVRMGINANSIPYRSTQKLVYRYTQGFAEDVPEGLFNPRKCTRQDRSSPIEAPLVKRLSVMFNLPWIFAQQVVLHCSHSSGNCMSLAFQDWFSLAYDVLIGVHLQEHEARLHHQ